MSDPLIWQGHPKEKPVNRLENLIFIFGWQGGTHTQANNELINVLDLEENFDFLVLSDKEYEKAIKEYIMIRKEMREDYNSVYG